MSGIHLQAGKIILADLVILSIMAIALGLSLYYAKKKGG